MAAFHIPGAYFLDEALLYRVDPRTTLDNLPPIDLADRARAERAIRGEIARYDRAHGDTPRLAPSLRYVRYLEAAATAGYDVFVCARDDCERVLQFALERAGPVACPDHPGSSLQQLAHVFAHARCGSVERLEPRRCWISVGSARCDGDLRLHIERADIGASYWWCPRCIAAKRRGRHTLFRRCPACTGAISGAETDDPSVPPTPADQLRMQLLPASAAYKPQSASALDMPGADEEATLNQWLEVADATQVELDALLQRLPEAARSDPVLQRQLKQHVRRSRGDAAARELSEDAIDELRDFAGARSARPNGVSLTAVEAQVLARDFGVSAQYLDGVSVLQMCFGYTIGSPDPSVARLMLFPTSGGRYAVLTRKQSTEGILFTLEAGRQRQLFGNEHREKSDQELREALIAAPGNDGVLQRTSTVLHTLSHILIRTSERHSGVSRDRLREIVMPRFSSVLIYIDGGSELGMLRTTFDASMIQWLEGARQNAQRCAYDPICARSAIRACHACLYLGERSCNRYWNRNLDRLLLVEGPDRLWS